MLRVVRPKPWMRMTVAGVWVAFMEDLRMLHYAGRLVALCDRFDPTELPMRWAMKRPFIQ